MSRLFTCGNEKRTAQTNAGVFIFILIFLVSVGGSLLLQAAAENEI